MKNIIKSYLLVVVGFPFIFNTTQAQTEPSQIPADFEIWSGVALKYKMNKAWSLGLDHQYRFKENASIMDQNFTQLEINRKLGKQFNVAFGSRFIRSNDTEGKIQGIDNVFRWNFDLGYKLDINRLDLSTRLRYQSKSEFASTNNPKNTLRVKFRTKYNIKKWKLDPVFAAEFFNKLGSSENLDKARYTLSTAYDFKKIGEFAVFYRYEKELNTTFPKSSNIIGLNYRYTFKKKK